MKNRTIRFVLLFLIIGLLFGRHTYHILSLSSEKSYTSYAVVIPFLVAYLIWKEKGTIFEFPEDSRFLAASLAFAGLLAVIVSAYVAYRKIEGVKDTLYIAGVLLLIIGAFAQCFGTKPIKAARFPLLLLFLMVPIPELLIERIVYVLQVGSTELSKGMFSILGVPVLQDGFVLTIPGISVEVAKECSGINSSIALLIIMLLVAHESLHATWRALVLLLFTIPLSVVKNAIRIVTLTMLATRVDPGFLTGRLHREGGFVFFLISLGLAYPVWKILRETERPRDDSDSATHMFEPTQPRRTVR